jgi:hypothetical protein
MSVNETVKQQAQRFVLAIIAAVVAITFILPLAMHHAPNSVRDEVWRMALLPAAVAWLLLWKVPGGHVAKSFRTVMLTIVLVGACGLGLNAASEQVSPWIRETVESARFVPQAIAYLGVGIAGLIGSLFAPGNSGRGD